MDREGFILEAKSADVANLFAALADFHCAAEDWWSVPPLCHSSGGLTFTSFGLGTQYFCEFIIFGGLNFWG